MSPRFEVGPLASILLIKRCMKSIAAMILVCACSEPVPELRIAPDVSSPLPVGTTRQFKVTEVSCAPDGEDGCDEAAPRDFSVTIQLGTSAELAAVDHARGTFDLRGAMSGRTDLLIVTDDDLRKQFAITVP